VLHKPWEVHRPLGSCWSTSRRTTATKRAPPAHVFPTGVDYGVTAPATSPVPGLIQPGHRHRFQRRIRLAPQPVPLSTHNAFRADPVGLANQDHHLEQCYIHTNRPSPGADRRLELLLRGTRARNQRSATGTGGLKKRCRSALGPNPTSALSPPTFCRRPRSPTSPRAAEAAGFGAVIFTEHPARPGRGVTTARARCRRTFGRPGGALRELVHAPAADVRHGRWFRISTTPCFLLSKAGRPPSTGSPPVASGSACGTVYLRVYFRRGSAWTSRRAPRPFDEAIGPAVLRGA